MPNRAMNLRWTSGKSFAGCDGNPYRGERVFWQRSIDHRRTEARWCEEEARSVPGQQRGSLSRIRRIRVEDRPGTDGQGKHQGISEPEPEEQLWHGVAHVIRVDGEDRPGVCLGDCP